MVFVNPFGTKFTFLSVGHHVGFGTQTNHLVPLVFRFEQPWNPPIESLVFLAAFPRKIKGTRVVATETAQVVGVSFFHMRFDDVIHTFSADAQVIGIGVHLQKKVVLSLHIHVQKS